MKLKKCPCGDTPTELFINGSDRDKWMLVSGTCCDEWFIDFRSNYLKLDDPELMKLAIIAWNETPRFWDK